MNASPIPETAIVILAAGGSVRLGQPKQLLAYKGSSLLEHIVTEVLSVHNSWSIIVIGSGKEAIREMLAPFNITVVINDDWQSGIAGTIKAGLAAALEQYRDLAACLFVVCDQPHLNTQLLQDMIALKQASGKGIVAAQYNDTIGTPVLFGRQYFEFLSLLQADEGARKIVHQYSDDVATISFPMGSLDIDTSDDYLRLIKAEKET